MGVRLNHAGISDMTKAHYVNMGMAKARAAKHVVELSPERMDLHQKLLIKRMFEAEERVKPKPEFQRDGKPVANTGKKSEPTLVSHGV